MATEHKIRVSARGEFGEIERGLKNLRRDLTDVTNVINRGARKGGLFDETQMRSLDVFNQRFKRTMEDVNKEFQVQVNEVTKLQRAMQKMDEVQRYMAREELKRREQAIDGLRKEYDALQKLHNVRNQEAKGFKSPGSGSGGGFLGRLFGGGGAGSAGAAATSTGFLAGFAGIASRVGMVGKFVAGLAGMASIMSMLSEAYDVAKSRNIDSLDLAQRMRGYGGRGGDAKSMYDVASEVGRRDKMGYTQGESWQFLNTYTSMAGGMSPEEQYRMQRFARGYGLDLNTVGGVMGQARQYGIASPTGFANSVAGSVGYSGMTPRILEVMETSVGLLQTINTTLKDGDAAQILAFQTTLDRIGTEKGMMKLTGAAGASIIQSLHGMYNPSDSNGMRWIGMSALKNYNPAKYGDMDYYDLSNVFEQGINHPDNIPALGKYINSTFGGDKKKSVLLLRSMMGGNMTIKQSEQLWDATEGFQKFDPNNKDYQNVLNSINNGDSNDKYMTRIDEYGQHILNVEAMYKKALEGLGQWELEAATTFKEFATKGLNILTDWATNTYDKIKGLLKEYLPEYADSISEGMDKMVKITEEGWEDIKSSWLFGGGGSKGGNLFERFLKWLQGTDGHGEVGTMGRYDVTKQSGVSAEKINDFLSNTDGASGSGQDFIDAGKEYGVDPAVLAAIARQENSYSSENNNLMGIMDWDNNYSTLRKFGNTRDSVFYAAKIIASMAKDGKRTVQDIGSMYAPIGADNDPNGLNKNWVGGVGRGVSQLTGVTGEGGPSRFRGSSIFNGWGDNVTSGYRTLRRPNHAGLDLGFEQGSPLDAIQGGIISDISYDWNNQTAGGTSMTVTMGNGRKYTYRHLSGIAPGLGVGSQISQGQIIAMSGGAPGAAGSGYSTTGAHLHLEYDDANDNDLDPSGLLSRVYGGVGGGDLGALQRGLNDTKAGIIPSDIKLTVDVNLHGDGVPSLNTQTLTGLEMIVRKVMEQIGREQLQLIPSMLKL